MSSSGAFWSYVHADDEAEGGRIVALARDVAAQYELITGDSIELFLDRDALQWGDRWREGVDSALASLAFFVAVMTPRYFARPECRRELQTFVREADTLGVRDLVLPLLYVEVVELHEPSPSDDLMGLVTDFQWEDWTGLRFKDRTSEPYREAVARLARRLADASEAAAGALVIPEVVSARADVGEAMVADDERPGSLDLMATAEAAMPRLKTAIEEVGSTVARIGDLANEAAAEVKRAGLAGQGFGGRIAIARRLANKLGPEASRLTELANEFTTHLYDVDGGIRAMIEVGSTQAQDSLEAKNQVCRLFRAILIMANTSREAMRSTQQMIDSIRPLEDMFRDLRPPLRSIRSSLAVLVEGQAVTGDWARLVEATGLDCQDSDADSLLSSPDD